MTQRWRLQKGFMLRDQAQLPGQLSILQEKIDHLERLLAENNEIISNIRDSVINLTLQADPKDCLFASQSGSQHPDVQMLDVYDLIPFDNPDGGVWKQGFDIKYEADEWDSEPLQVFVVPHSHNDPVAHQTSSCMPQCTYVEAVFRRTPWLLFLHLLVPLSG
ncbi:alpha-mannosidase 2-like, partial [Psammomys obesus]|uniref:alpha-mannosidase 2-like n=1 Tax=Psammomys obesus TaxID=48139 RepID=UPI0024534826